MRICLVAVLGVLVLVAGCTSSPDRKPTPKPSASATTVTPIAPAKATALKVGTDLPVVEDLPEKIGKENTNFIGFASSNVLFGQLSVPDKGSKGSVTTQSHPMLYNRNSRSATLLDDGLVRPAKTKVLDMVSVEANTVWVESSKVNPADGDISVYSYDRTSRFRRLMTDTPVHDPKLVYADDLAVVGTRVYFSMASIDHKSGEGSAIYSAAASGGGHVKVLVPDGQRITVDGTKMTYFVGKKKFVRDFDSGDTTPAPISSHAGDATFCGAVFRTAYKAVCDGDSVGQSGVVGAVLTVTSASGRATKIGPFPGSAPHVVGVVGPWLAFSSSDSGGSSQEYLLNLASRKLSVLPKGVSLGPAVDPNLALLDTRDAAGLIHQSIVGLPVL
ncbi:MAG: hypothetical protein JWQ70_2998 [Aeromicrobium sp.]|nr:hypothetical protein [Aeromicrobium sp.]